MVGRRVVAGAAVVVFAAVVLIAGMVGRPTPMGTATDRLGPGPGMSVADYLDGAHGSLTAASGSEPRWALVSFRRELTPAQAADLAGSLRVARVIYRVPIDRVQTPLVAIDVPSGRRAVLDSAAQAASHILTSRPSDDRAEQVAAVAAARLRTQAPAVVALTVRGDPNRLRALAAEPDVRAVEALPADAVAGHFAVTPLLPDQTDRVVPGPDDGPVPPAA